MNMNMRGFLIAALLAAASTGAASLSTRFALIGDFGANNSREMAVSQLVRTNFQPDFVVTIGDNNYIGAANIDTAIGQYYHEFIGNYIGAFGPGASSNRFFPALGNHDWDSSTGFASHTNYFSLPGSERYYDFVRGPVHVFVLNTDPHEPDGNTVSSTQGRWFSNAIARSTSPWRIVVAHDPPYSSTEAHAFMRWPFQQWGASIVISGDSHNYERIMLNGFPYVVNGLGGASMSGFGSPVNGSVVRYNSDHGAMLVTATDTNIVYEFWSVAGGGTLIDRFTQQVPPQLSCVLTTNETVHLSWPTNGADGCVLEWTQALPGSWNNVPETPVILGATKTVTLSTTGQWFRFFRLRK
ncbi:MAG TPA: metallophosphoesterase [Methylomirabilota bacterium]|nr:metallophosphoesterase [Methylomirabilota bacterium]